MLGEHLRVLLVDDDESFVNLLGHSLEEEYRYEVRITHSVREAISAVETSQRGFDVILLDYMMPELTGLNFLQWMYEQKNETPVVVLTGAGSEEVAVEAMKLGAYDYARKEQIELRHLDILIKSTHERHLFRVERSLEEERGREMILNKEATDKVRDVINAITPSLHSALASLNLAIEAGFSGAGNGVAGRRREELHRQLRVLETGIRGLLSVYQLLYAHHSEAADIDRIRDDVQKRIQAVFENQA
ncbi:MAG TPA: response regulator [Bacteroidota bacterium]|nr:response regulator [Bacteroidota bacterium]